MKLKHILAALFVGLNSFFDVIELCIEVGFFMAGKRETNILNKPRTGCPSVCPALFFYTRSNTLIVSFMKFISHKVGMYNLFGPSAQICSSY